MAIPAWFDESAYLNSKLNQLESNGVTGYTNINQVMAAIKAAGMTTYSHYTTYGLIERTSPNDYFNTDEYLAAKAVQMNTALGVTTWTADKVSVAFQNAGFTNAYDHFAKYGWLEGVNPSNAFDVSSYLALKVAESGMTLAEVKAAFTAAGLDPISHYMAYGHAEAGMAVTEVPFPEQVFAPGTDGHTFHLTDSTIENPDAGGLKTMHLSGDADVRIDLTHTSSQITGLDLNGDGIIANDGKENALNVYPASGYVAVDAYTRLDNGVVNETNLHNVFLGDINYDGSGFAGDGVATNGNIVLGGLGADTILGGIGNDFLAGGGVAQSNTGFDSLSGGRNADFMFAELSLLSSTDGNQSFIDGGSTADDTSAANGQSSQDSDWLLLQASDDDEPVVVNLQEDPLAAVIDHREDGTLTTRSGQYAVLRDIENVDASGNTYGFLKGISTTIGGAPVNANNNGIGSSAQLHIDGSQANNILIGGYDNDVIEGRSGNDLLMGGNLRSYADDGIAVAHQILDPNLVGLVGNNDGRDELIGGGGADNIVFEADGGVIEGGWVAGRDDSEVDTLWLTENSLGAVVTATNLTPVNAGALTTDNTLRFDLAVGKEGGLANSSGYGGADLDAATGNYTADQSNYISANRTQVQDMENVIATGLGAIDYRAAGGNSATDVLFQNQQNFQSYQGNLDLRGTYIENILDNNEELVKTLDSHSVSMGANILYAAGGNDVIEGRTGNDLLSGGDGIDQFIFGTMDGGGVYSVQNGTEGNSAPAFVQNQSVYGDNIDVIWRQSDKNHDNIWDNYSETTGVGDFERDFGIGSSTTQTPSGLLLTLNVSAIDTTSNPLVANDVREIDITVAGTDVVLTTSGMAAAATMEALLAEVQSALVAHGDDNLSASLLNNTITIADDAGRVLGGVGYVVVQNSGGSFQNTVQFEAALSNTVGDVLLFTSYENRADGELTNDNSVNGSTISLGVDSYAQDRVVSFSDNDGKVQTRIAEDQAYDITFTNLTTQDIVTITVNDVKYQLQVGKDLDGRAIAAEDGLGDTQADIQNAFLTRLEGFINSFMDTNTAAGQVSASLSGNTLTLTQQAYNGEETVFMKSPIVTLGNASGGEPASYVVVNNADHEVLLYEYDGLNNGLNAANVKFIGATGITQSTLETAKDAGQTLIGNEAIVIDGGSNDLVATVTNTPLPATTTAQTIADNTNTNAALSTNFSVHGDDLLIGGKGNDTIYGRTGDDRILGSLGTDTLDGGKDWYAVKVLNETQTRVVEMNTWEAANPTARVAALNGLILSSTTLIDQTQNGADLVSGSFNDTLMFQQADFDAANTRFTITLDDFAVDASTKVVSLTHGGAGHVEIDVAGDGTLDAGQVTTFTNFENIRTVSGTGLAVANNGQGNDTLNVTLLSTATGGISYNLTNDGGQGEVNYSVDTLTAHTVADPHSIAADYEKLVMKVDGVENVIGGTGDDLLTIDETEAAKNNSFDGGLGLDRIDYTNNFGSSTAEPKVTIIVDSATDVDQVVMTGGRVAAAGPLGATDTLTSVEYITLGANTATGSGENDVLDVTNMKSGAIVNYIDGTVKDLLGVTHVTIENLYQVENVWADGNDTVIVADADIMGKNTLEDFDGAPKASTDLTFATFLDFDTLSTETATLNKRIPFANQTADQIDNAINQGEFTFNLSKTGTGADVDTVDYSNANDSISVVVNLDASQPNQYVLVDAELTSVEYPFDDVEGGEPDRVDVLIGVEQVVASQGDSILDLTNSTKNLEIKFSALDLTQRVAALDRDVYSVKISDLDAGTPLNRTYLEYRDAGQLDTGVTAVTQATAIWNSIEGSDFAESVIMNSAHSTDDGNFNLRGGANAIKYNELTRSIETTVMVTEFDKTDALNTGLITATTHFTDGIATGSGRATLLADSGTHIATSYTQQNGIASGSLRIAASQDAEDSVSFQGSQDKLFILGVVGTTDNLIEVKVGNATDPNSIVLTGYEFLLDAETNDSYDMKSLAKVLGNLTLVDGLQGPGGDHDAIKVYDDAADALYGGSASTISLAGLNAAFNFDFDVLNVTGVTSAAVTTLIGTPGVGPTDEVVLGAINSIATLTDFEGVVMTDATLAAGSTIVLNTELNTLTVGSKVLTDTTDSLNTVSFRGEVLEAGTLDGGQVANVTSAITFSVAGTSTDAVAVFGGNGADHITGGGGDDYIQGGQGNDILDGGFIPSHGEVQTIVLGGGAAILTGAETLTITGIGANALIIGGSGSGAELMTATATADGDQIGALLHAQSTTYLETQLGYTAGSIASTAYDVASNKFSITFTDAAGAQTDVTTAITPLSTMTAVASETTAYAARGESADTYVFEATAALNGVDTLNNVDASDKVDFHAFLTAVQAQAGVVNGVSADMNMTTTSGDNYGVFFNHATLTAAQVSTTGTAAFGELIMADNAKAVVMTTADADGAGDLVQNSPYNVYFVEDTDASATAQTWSVTLVGTVNSAAELNAAQVLAMAA